MEKKIDGNYTRMLRAIMNKPMRKGTTKKQQYSHLPPITKTIHIRRTRHAGYYWRSKDGLISDELLRTPSQGGAKNKNINTAAQCDTGCSLDDILRERWTIGTGGERGSGRSMLTARHDDDDVVCINCVLLL